MSKFANREEYEKWKASKTTREPNPAGDIPDSDTSTKADAAPAPGENKNYPIKIISSMLAILLIIVALGIGTLGGLFDKPKSLGNRALAKYDKKYYWLEEGTSLSGTPIEHFVTPTIVEVTYHPNELNLLSLECMTADKSQMVNLEVFENLLKNVLTREATQDERLNAKWYKEKRDDSEVIHSITIKGNSVKRWDLADDVFNVFTKQMEIKEPGIVRGDNEEIMTVIHDYKIDGIEYSLLFKRMENDSDKYCRNCSYRLSGIIVYPNKSLTFKEYIQKYWTASK